jgi:TPR repeat protein
MVSNGLVPKEIQNGTAMLLLDSLLPHFCVPFSDEDLEVLTAAVEGDAASQTDVALILLAAGKATNAIYWLNLAAQQNFADAMHFLGRCFIDGNGVDRDKQTGIALITKAATQGHVISRAQLKDLNQFL